MNIEHTDSLHNSYPLTFKHKVGFECGDGWFELLSELFTKIEYIQKTTGIRIEPTQIKEKYGTLRFYYSPLVPSTLTTKINWVQVIDGCIDAAEDKSEHTCEECGKPGTIEINNGWMRVSCGEHNK